MKTIQITIDETLLSHVDEVVQAQETNRSSFIRNALQAALRDWDLHQLESQHATGYQRHPVAAGEFDDWDDEQVWGDE